MKELIEKSGMGKKWLSKRYYQATFLTKATDPFPDGSGRFPSGSKTATQFAIVFQALVWLFEMSHPETMITRNCFSIPSWRQRRGQGPWPQACQGIPAVS